ncbi:MAG TPA: dihydropteroate synthase [Bacillota bacterium]|nr:dihydropteroate synthase [Bacillota bacterium]
MIPAQFDFKKGRIFDFTTRSYVMGIMNITPDSFSQDGLYRQTDVIDRAVTQAVQMIADGADILDLGAESTRPGAPPVDAAEEARRLFPVLKELVNTVDVPISIDSYKPEIAEKAIEYGAALINDIWGLRSPDDPEFRMAKVVAEADIPVVIMHNQIQAGYENVIHEVITSLRRSIEIALTMGIDLNKIIVDPGIGFAKSYQDNLMLLHHLDQLKILERPILLGVSRKSVIGKTLDLPVEERLEGTIAANVWGVAKGANLVRVHDVKAISRAIKMCDAISHA